ncbi:MAG: hypothetical protein AB1938_26810 [Myxococcota bacterium]
MAHGWSIGGKRIEFRAALPAGKIVVVDSPGGQPVHEQKLAAKGEWEVPVGDKKYRLVRTPGFAAPKMDVFSPRGELVPPTDKHVAPAPAPAGSTCAPHQAAARYACARCGLFVCEECAGADLTHCRKCIEGLVATAQKNAAAMAYMAPVLVFAIMGGLLGGILGALAGAGSVAIARRTENTALKLGAAVGLYALAVIVWVVIAAFLRA